MMDVGYADTILSVAKLLLIILTNLYLTGKKIKIVSQIKDGNELLPAPRLNLTTGESRITGIQLGGHGGKRQFMAPGGQFMVWADKSWRKTTHHVGVDA